MNSITVYSLLSYLTETNGITWRNNDYDAMKAVKLLKRKHFGGYIDIIDRGKTNRFFAGDRDKFMPFLYAALAEKLGHLTNGSEFSIVPIPNKAALSTSDEIFDTLDMANNIAAIIGERASVVPALRWTERLIPASQGGSRDPQYLRRRLKLMMRPTSPVVLFDDVMTTGSHARACSWKLSEIAAAPVGMLAAGRTTKEQLPEMIGWRVEDLALS
jgi:hypothetical protein